MNCLWIYILEAIIYISSSKSSFSPKFSCFFLSFFFFNTFLSSFFSSYFFPIWAYFFRFFFYIRCFKFRFCKKETKLRLSETQTALSYLSLRKMSNIMKLVIIIARTGNMTIAGDEYVCQSFADIVIKRLRCLNAAFRNELFCSVLWSVPNIMLCFRKHLEVTAESHRR